MLFNERVNRITSRDYNPIFDTDFASLVRYDRFPSLLYGSGATFLKIGLWYGGAASSFIPIFPVYSFCFDKYFIIYVLDRFWILRPYFLIKNHGFAKISEGGRFKIPAAPDPFFWSSEPLPILVFHGGSDLFSLP